MVYVLAENILHMGIIVILVVIVKNLSEIRILSEVLLKKAYADTSMTHDKLNALLKYEPGSKPPHPDVDEILQKIDFSKLDLKQQEDHQ